MPLLLRELQQSSMADSRGRRDGLCLVLRWADCRTQEGGGGGRRLDGVTSWMHTMLTGLPWPQIGRCGRGEMLFALHSWVYLRGEAGGRQQDLQENGHHIERMHSRAVEMARSSPNTTSDTDSSSHLLSYTSSEDSERQRRDPRPCPALFRKSMRRTAPWDDLTPIHLSVDLKCPLPFS